MMINMVMKVVLVIGTIGVLTIPSIAPTPEIHAGSLVSSIAAGIAVLIMFAAHIVGHFGYDEWEDWICSYLLGPMLGVTVGAIICTAAVYQTIV